MKTCLWCNKPLHTCPSPGRTPKYCSGSCRKAACVHRNRIPNPIDRIPRWLNLDSLTHHVLIPGIYPESDLPKHTKWKPIDDIPNHSRRGFLLTGDGIVCLVARNAVDRAGLLLPWMRELVESMESTWMCHVPGTQNVQVWGFAEFPVNCRSRYRRGELYLYADRHVVDIPRAALPGCAKKLGDIHDSVERLFKQL